MRWQERKRLVVVTRGWDERGRERKMQRMMNVCEAGRQKIIFSAEPFRCTNELLPAGCFL